MRYFLVHGGWQGGWCWDSVVGGLRRRGHDASAPTLRGLEEGNVDRSDVSLDQMIDGAALELQALPPGPIVLVGHSGGGPVIQSLWERMRDRISRLVFVDAWVLRDGENIYDILPDAYVDATRRIAAASGDQTIPMAPDLWADKLMNTVSRAEADRWLKRVVPCPEGWQLGRVSLPTFASSPPKSSYIFLEDDVSFPREVWTAQAERLHQPCIAYAPGPHEAMITNGEELAEVLIRVAPESA